MCKCKDCEFADVVYFKDVENGNFYPYSFNTIVNCMKFNKFIINGDNYDEC